MPGPYNRLDIWSLAVGDPTVVAYANAVKALKAKPASDPTSWTFQAAIHGTRGPAPSPAAFNQCRHGTWYFLPWHRMYVFYFERIVRAQVVTDGGPEDWALPYWNYEATSHNSLPLAFRQAILPDGSENPLFVAERGTAINEGAGLPASITASRASLARPIFVGANEFGGGVTPSLGQFLQQTGRLEQTPHNNVHDAIGGLMGDPDTAAEDPIFWLHHANIDRLWWVWQQQHSNPTTPAWLTQRFGFFDAGGAVASQICSGVEDIAQLGYSYV